MAGNLKELGVSETEFEEKKADIARKTAELSLLKSLPKPFSSEELESLLTAAFRGKENEKK